MPQWPEVNKSFHCWLCNRWPHRSCVSMVNMDGLSIVSLFFFLFFFLPLFVPCASAWKDKRYSDSATQMQYSRFLCVTQTKYTYNSSLNYYFRSKQHQLITSAFFLATIDCVWKQFDLSNVVIGWKLGSTACHGSNACRRFGHLPAAPPSTTDWTDDQVAGVLHSSVSGYGLPWEPEVYSSWPGRSQLPSGGEFCGQGCWLWSGKVTGLNS